MSVNIESSSLLEELKVRIRITSSTFDDMEILPLANACITDLSLGGVKRIDITDPLIKQAIVLYVKANFGVSDESGKFQRAYEGLKNSLALCGDYTENKQVEV